LNNSGFTPTLGTSVSSFIDPFRVALAVVSVVGVGRALLAFDLEFLTAAVKEGLEGALPRRLPGGMV